MPQLRSIILAITFFMGHTCPAQDCKTDAKLVSSRAAYLESVRSDPRKKMVALSKLIPGLVIDMPYATTHNFTHTVLYHNPVACLRQEPANSLRMAQEELKKKGLVLKLLDSYRPFSVSCKMWRLVPDRHYVANPRKGSNHNRGLAVDVTLIDIKTGKELDMGTGFDNFTDSAHHDFMLLPSAAIANRKLLKQTMRKYGFGMVPSEWWHYQYRNDADYEVLDLDFGDILE